MKIENTKPTIETGGQSVYEESFAIGNLGRIMKILRNSMYANPIKAICREISSNARDAHREIGIGHRSIEIHLPNDLDEHFTIKDYGPGISHERMSNVFIRYGTSTKNDDNIQTGGFGLGAKTPFAYTDQFQITTIAPDNNGQNIKSIYIAYIDESEAGKMRLMFSVPTDEPSGTEISIIVAKEDFHKFIEATIDVCQYWDPRPKLTGNVIPVWPEDNRELFIDGADWKMFKNNNQYNVHTSLLIVDGISYPINPHNINNIDYDSNEFKLLTKGLKIIVNIGEVTLSANREELQYDNKTCNLIKSKLSEIMNEIVNLSIKKINNYDNYLEACLFFRDFKKYLNFTSFKDFKVEWRGNVLCDRMIMFNSDIYFNDKGGQIIPYHIDLFELKINRRTYKNTLSRENTKFINVEKDCIIIINDISENKVSRNRVKYYIENNNYNKVFVITFSDKNVQRGLEQLKNDNVNNIDINLLNPIMMSTINPPRQQVEYRGGRGSGRSAYKAFYYDSTYTAYRKCDNNWRPTKIDMINGEGIYITLSGRTNNKSSQKVSITDNEIENIITYMNDENFKIYGIREKDTGRLGDGWIPLKIWLEAKVSEDIKNLDMTYDDLHKIMDQYDSEIDVFNTRWEDHFTNIINKFRNKFSDKSLMIKYYNMSHFIIEQKKLLSPLWNIANIFKKNKNKSWNTDELPLVKLKDEFEKTYNMLNYVNQWSGITSKELMEYITIIDLHVESKAALDIAAQYEQPITVNE